MAFQATILAPVVPLGYCAISIAMYARALNVPHQRIALVTPMLYFQHMSLATSNHFSKIGLDSLWGLSVCIWTLHSLSMLFLESCDFFASIHDTPPHSKGPWYRNSMTWKTWNNLRLLDTVREEGLAPRYFHGSQSRPTFAVVRTTKLALYLATINFVQPLILPGFFMPFDRADFDEIHQTYFRRILMDVHSITARETILRAVFAIFWAFSSYLLLDAAHAALSLFCVVVLRADDPQQWPPIFGHLRDASSLRSFWGKFWHRLVVLPYGSYGKFIAEKLLGLRPVSRLHKLIVAFTIFLISGISHAAIAYHLDDRTGHLDVWWFCLNFFASTLEGVVRSSIAQCEAASGLTSLSRLTPSVRKCLGFVWVFLFFFWSVPKWQYPKIPGILDGIDVSEIPS